MRRSTHVVGAKDYVDDVYYTILVHVTLWGLGRDWSHVDAAKLYVYDVDYTIAVHVTKFFNSYGAADTVVINCVFFVGNHPCHRHYGVVAHRLAPLALPPQKRDEWGFERFWRGEKKREKPARKRVTGKHLWELCRDRERRRERQYLFLFHTSYGRFGLLFAKGRCN